MSPTVEVISHLVVFLLGIATCRAVTVWEGHQINQQGEPPMSETEPETSPESKAAHRRVSRGKAIALFVIVGGIFLAGLGYQQNQYQKQNDAQQEQFQSRIADIAQCYQDWGKDVTDTLDARAKARTAQSAAERARSNSIDNVLLLFLAFRKADPPLSEAEQKAQFDAALNKFGRAKARLVKEDQKVKQVQGDNAYPKLDCVK